MVYGRYILLSALLLVAHAPVAPPSILEAIAKGEKITETALLSPLLKGVSSTK